MSITLFGDCEIPGHPAYTLRTNMRTVRQLFDEMTPGQLWSLVGVVATILVSPSFSHAQWTNSVVSVGSNGSAQNLCKNQQSLNGPTLATCGRSVHTDNTSGAATAAAEAAYGALGIGGNVAVVNDKSSIEMQAHAEADFLDYLKVGGNLPSEYFLEVVSALAATSSGSSSGTVFVQVEINNGAGGCTLTGFGKHSCTSIVGPFTPQAGGFVSLYVRLFGEADVQCNPGCGGGAAGFSAGYSKPLPPANTVLAVIPMDGNKNPLQGVTITGLSGHKYPTKFASTVTLSSSHNPSTEGQSVTFKSTVTSFGRTTKPTGIVRFKDETTNTLLGSAVLSNGVASLTTSQLSLGTHVIGVSYGGDHLSSGSSSRTISQVVN